MVLTLLCDEHIPYPVVKGLRRRGLDVITVQEMGLSSAEDKTIMDRAREEGRVIYTRNGDFLRLHHTGFKHAGIFYHPSMAYSVGEAIRKDMTSCELFAAEEIRNQIKFL